MSNSGDRITQLLDEFRHSRDVMVAELGKVIIGQREVIEQILAAIFTRGHVLLVGVPGPGQDADGQLDRPDPRRRLQADPVHARPDALGHHRHQRPGGARGRPAGVPVRPRADLRQHHPGRRDQPHPAQDPGRAARRRCRSARSPSARRRCTCPTRSSSSPPRTRSSRRGPTRCPRPSSTASCSTSASATRRSRRRRRSSRRRPRARRPS